MHTAISQKTTKEICLSSLQKVNFECVEIINNRQEFFENRKNPLKKMTPSILVNAEDEKIEGIEE